MPDDEMARVRERVAVAETLLQTVARSLDKLVNTVETMAELVNQQKGQAQITSRLEAATLAGAAGWSARS
jgi:hypothetical protein